MPEHCTCGARLAEGALFCHKCGKPQREIADVEPAPEPVSEQPVPVRIPLPAPGFKNPVAVRTGLSMAALAVLLIWIPLVNLLAMFLLGALSAFLYKRRTGEPLTIGHGARMGWMTGVFSFMVWAVLFTVTFAAMSFTGGSMNEYREQLKNWPAQAESVQQFLDMLQNPKGIATILLLTFITITGLCTAGGALGAIITGKADS